jgi:large subunit ribosomal protein L21
MKAAVIRTGGQQYRVSEGETIRVDQLAGEPGSKVEFSEVLLVGGDSAKIGKPLVSGAKVQAEIVAHGRGEKLVIFKFKRRKKYRRKNGHRQAFTAVRITSIQG